MKVSFLSNYPVPYQSELLRAVEARGELQVRSFFLQSRDPSRSWPDEHGIPGSRILPSLKAPGFPDELRIHPTLVRELWEPRPDLTVVCGYSYLTFQLAMAQLIALRRPFAVWAEVPRVGEGNLAVRTVRSTLLAPVRRARGVLAVGRRAAEVWRGTLGGQVPVANFPYVCDIARYLSLALPDQPRQETTFLFCGQLTPRKGPDVLLQAFERLADENPRVRLLLAGEGPDRAKLESSIPPRHASRVEFLGFQRWEALPSTYRRADVLVVPSRHDGWALVVNEALAAGLPVISSTRVGAGLDLIVPGRNGWLVEPGSAEDLLRAMREAPRAAFGMRREARRTGEALALDRAAERLAVLLGRIFRGESRLDDAEGLA